MYHTGLLTACEQDQDGTPFRPDPACRVLFQKKIEKLVHLVGFIIRIPLINLNIYLHKDIRETEVNTY